MPCGHIIQTFRPVSEAGRGVRTSGPCITKEHSSSTSDCRKQLLSTLQVTCCLCGNLLTGKTKKRKALSMGFVVLRWHIAAREISCKKDTEADSRETTSPASKQSTGKEQCEQLQVKSTQSKRSQYREPSLVKHSALPSPNLFSLLKATTSSQAS